MKTVLRVLVRVVCFLMFGSMIAILYFSGYFRDEMDPIIDISSTMTNGTWVLAAGSAVLLLWSFPAMSKGTSGRQKAVFGAVLLVAMIGFGTLLAVGGTMVKDYHPGVQNEISVDGEWLEKQQMKAFPEDDKVKSAEWIATYYSKEAQYHLVGGKYMDNGKQKLKVYVARLSKQGKDVKFHRLTPFTVIDMDAKENSLSAQTHDQDTGLTLHFYCGIRKGEENVYFNGAPLDLETGDIYGVIRPSPFDIEVRE